MGEADGEWTLLNDSPPRVSPSHEAPATQIPAPPTYATAFSLAKAVVEMEPKVPAAAAAAAESGTSPASTANIYPPISDYVVSATTTHPGTY